MFNKNNAGLNSLILLRCTNCLEIFTNNTMENNTKIFLSIEYRFIILLLLISNGHNIHFSYTCIYFHICMCINVEMVTFPQALQWCLRKVTVNSLVHSWHMVTRASGIQTGAFLPRTNSLLSSSALLP